MIYSDIINELSKRYKELQEQFRSVQNLVNDIDFVFVYTEEEQHLFYRMSNAMEEHCGALLKLIRFLKKHELEENGIKDWSQYKKTDSAYIGVDVSDEGDHGACCQVGEGPADVNETPDGIKALEGMQVVHAFNPGHRCDGCSNYTECNRNWKKLELVGGYYLCLAPLPNSIVTE